MPAHASAEARRRSAELRHSESGASSSTSDAMEEAVPRTQQRRGSLLSVFANSRPIMVLDGTPTPERKWFCKWMAATSIINAVLLGVEVSVCGLDDVDPSDRIPWMITDIVMSLVFLIETFLRIDGYGLWTWACGDVFPEQDAGTAFYNWFDAILALSRCTWILNLAGATQIPKLLSSLRLVTIGNLARVMQSKHQYRELWAFILGMVGIVPTLTYMACFIAGFLYWFAVVMTILVSAESNDYDYNWNGWTAQDYWGTVPQSMLTLAQVLTLDHWYSRVARPLVLRHTSFIMVLLLFVLVGNIGLLNLLTSYFVEGTLAAAVDAKDRKFKEEQLLDKLVMASFRSYVEQADYDASGSIEQTELDYLVNTFIVRDRLRLLGIAPGDLKLLFTLLDETGNGQIQIDKFFRGVLRLRGDAMASDLYKLTLDLSRGITQTASLVQGINSTNESLKKVIESTSSMDVGVVKGDADVYDEVLTKKRKRIDRDEARAMDDREREHQILVRFGVEDPEKSEELGREPGSHGRANGASTKKLLMHASLRDGTLKAAISRENSMKSSTVKQRLARTMSRSRQATKMLKQATVGSAVTRSSDQSAATKSSMGLAVQTRKGLRLLLS